MKSSGQRPKAGEPSEPIVDPLAFMFPGQGSQRVGMWQALGARSDIGRRRLAEAQDRLGLELGRVMDEGPDGELTRTDMAQPCLLLVDVVCAERLIDRGLGPVVYLGHSLGEYAALVLAGVLGFGDALELVRTRGLLMARAAEEIPGGMAAVLGMERAGVEQFLAEVGPDARVEIANINAPRQVVISGETGAVATVVHAVNKSRRGRAVPLAVSAPFHSSLMEPVAEAFREHLGAVLMKPPQGGFIDNVTGSFERDPERIRAKLVEQIFRPVLWEQGVLAARAQGVCTFVECGPGRVLTGLLKRIAGDATRLVAGDLLR
jgi:[acyl-carrier-protein] S-malonyltransferase